ncbi:membrane protein [Actinoplanes lobatus]|uniref:Uncharacterized protein n=1 Tax=Actinoplanes lobatus TaxID=113568 RepID=A0A7W7HLX5_9ACTN|nr:hypothetical protein [Actinoplanes lobatus]MBB4752647.1 hypothetical protein [Actinoplanes lobatus]GGN93736.1 membrane protein [Actinoplanes lobatus]
MPYECGAAREGGTVTGFGIRGGTTRAVLWRSMVVLELAVVAVLGMSAWVLQGTRATAERAGNHSVPSIMHILAAHAALVEADEAAVGSFRTGAVGLTGPGERYQNQIAVAAQSLTRLAVDSIAGAVVGQNIQLVQGQLAAYTGLIEQADAHYRQDPASVLARADLWYASHLLHMPDGGILAQLDDLLSIERRALAGQLTTGRMAPGWMATWIVPAVVLLALLVTTQVFLSRRFRRTFNPPLLAATIAVLAATAAMSADFAARGELAATQKAGDALVGVWQARTAAADHRGQTMLRELVAGACPDGCRETLDRIAAGIGGTREAPGEEVLTARIKEVDGHATAAADTTGQLILLVLAALAAMALIPFGFVPRINEYR